MTTVEFGADNSDLSTLREKVRQLENEVECKDAEIDELRAELHCTSTSNHAPTMSSTPASTMHQTQSITSPKGHKRARTAEPVKDVPPPDMSLLSMPVSRSWKKTEWAAYHKADEAHFKECNSRKRKPPHYDAWGGRLYDYFDQGDAARKWTEPSELMLRICVPSKDISNSTSEGTLAEIATERLHRDDPKTFRSIIEAVCASNALHRDSYYWVIEQGAPKNVMNGDHRTDLLREEDTFCFSRLWCPSNSCFWESEDSYYRRLIATPKSSLPYVATQPPSFDLLKSPPPEGNASAAEWESWHEKNCCGAITFWIQKNAAVKYRCPPVVPLRLEGVTHSVTVDADADAALCVAVADFAAAGEGVTPMTPSELLIKDGDGEILDQQTTTARCLFDGARSTPRTLQVVHRDETQHEAALKDKHGQVPEGYAPFDGLGYLVKDTEAPWLISADHGVTAYNSVARSLSVYEGSDFGPYENGVRTYNPIIKWWEMCKLLKKEISTVARKPKCGWSHENSERAIDRFTGILLVTLLNDEWRCDALGKIMGWDPKCRKETILIMKRMDEAAVKLITAANAILSEEIAEPNGMLGLPRTLAQTKRLLMKLQKEYHGYSEPDSGPGYNHHKGYLSFSKAIPLLS